MEKIGIRDGSLGLFQPCSQVGNGGLALLEKAGSHEGLASWSLKSFFEDSTRDAGEDGQEQFYGGLARSRNAGYRDFRIGEDTRVIGRLVRLWDGLQGKMEAAYPEEW